ncbi:MAG: hypothetical protein EOP11_03770 [Proteobacteria bacterium]|nr:MAG: hypothetical protein EOP11_03770 [Pseudomonadota bacterium]
MRSNIQISKVSATALTGIALLWASAMPARGAGEVAPGFSLDGTLYNSPTGTNTLLDTAMVRVQIYNPNKDCLLYDERQTVNTTSSEGAFSVQVGSNLASSHRVVGSDPGLAMVMVFQNTAALVGAGGCSYAPALGDIRFVRVSVTPSSTGITDVLSPDIVIATVPSALVAERAENLQGVGKAGFLQLGTQALTQANVASIFTNAGFAALTNLIAGGGSSNAGSAGGNYVIDAGTAGSGSIDFNTAGSTKASIASNGNFSVDAGSFYVDAASNRVGIGTSAPAASLDLSNRTDAVALPKGSTAQAPGAPVAGMIRFNTDKLVVEFFNGMAWVDPATGSITSIVGAGGISASTLSGTTTVQLQDTIGNVVSAGSATTVPAITVDAKGRITAITSTAISGVAPSGAAGGDLDGSYPDPTIGKIQGQPLNASAPSGGQFLKFSSGAWANSNILRTDLKSSISGNLFIGTSCTAGQSLYWDSATDTIQCQNIAIDASAVTAGVLDIARIPAAAKLWAADGTGKISYTAGNVGVGTSAPNAPLDVVGDVNTTTWYRSGSVAILRNSAGTTSLRSTGSINFSVGASGSVTAATIDSAGNVGIGSATPGAPLDVAGAARVSGLFSVQNGNGTGGIRLGADVNATTLTAGVRKVGRIFVPTFDNVSPNVLAFSGDNDGTDNNIFYGGYPGSSTVTAATRLRFLTAPALNTTGGTERLTIDGNGLVGIGSVSPKAGLDINSTGNLGSAIIVPRDTVANRPVAPVNGMIRYASDTNVMEAYVNGGWTTLGTLGGSQSFAGNVNVGGSFTSAGSATFNNGATVAGGALALSSQNITGVGAEITGSGALSVAAGGTNQSLALTSSGSGAVNLGSGNGTSLSVLDGGAATVNYVTIKGGASGVAPSLAVAGPAANINLSLMPKGTGGVGVGIANPGAKFEVVSTVDALTFNVRNLAASTTSMVNFNAPLSTSVGDGKAFAVTAGNEGLARSVFYTDGKYGIGPGSTTRDTFISRQATSVMKVSSDGASGLADLVATGKVGVGTTAPTAALDVRGTLSSATGLDYGAKILSTVNASGTAGYTSLLVNATQTAVGSGVKRLLDLQADGTTRFSVGNDGATSVAGQLSAQPSSSTAAAPSITFGNTTGTGFFSTAASNFLGVATAGLERMRIDSSGSVAIGTTTPTTGAILDVNGTGANSAMMLPRDTTANRPTPGVAGMLRYNTTTNQFETYNGTTWTSPVQTSNPTFSGAINISASSTAAYVVTDASNVVPLAANAGLNMNNSAAADGNGTFIRFGSNNAAAANQKALIGIVTQATGNTPALIFGQQTGPSSYEERMRIDPTGRISVGIVAPKDSHAALALTGPGSWTHLETNASRGAGAAVTSSISSYNNATNIANVKSSTGTNVTSGVLTFETANSATLGERMRIDQTGNVGIGSTAPNYKLEVVGDINATGNVRAAGAVLTSDIRYKQDIRPLEDSLAKLMRLRGVSYFWRQSEFPEKHFNDRAQVGVIAQDVEKVFPELVDTDKKGFKAVNYSAFVAPLIEAVKSLFDKTSALEARTQAENQALKLRADKLEKENAALRARMDRIERRLSSH